MVLPIPIKDKKAIHEEDLAMKLKSISENIEQDLSKYLRGLKVVYSCKTSSFPRVTSKINKKMKQRDFQVLRKINVKGNKFKL